MLSTSRWVTIVGPLGSGKSRLAREVASAAAATVHVELAPAETLSSLESRFHALQARDHPLLVLDGAERAPEAIRTLLPRWLGVHPARRALVTSRLRLASPDDTTLWMPPFGPEDAHALFEQFVRAAGSTFDFAAHPSDLAMTLRELGDAPLAILALAQRALVLGPSALFASAATASGRLDLPTPHGTLRESAAEAWNALPEQARAQLRALAVFAGPATVDDIVAVCGFDGSVLQLLLSHSAIRTRMITGRKHHEVVSLLRDFARETSLDEDARRRHRDEFLRRAMAQPGDPPWRELMTAAEGALDPADALALSVAAAPGLAHGGSARRGLAALERAWPEQPTPAQRLAFGTLARIAGESGRGIAELRAGLEETSDPARRAELACALATFQRHTHAIEYARATFEALITSEATPDATRAITWEQLGGLEFEQGSARLAEQHLQHAEDLFLRMTDRGGVARVRHVRGLLAQERGDFEAAERAFTVAVRDHQAAGADRFAAIACFDLGALRLECGRIGAARRQLLHALGALQHAGDRRQVGLTHALLGVCAFEDGDIAAAWFELRAARASIDSQDLQIMETLGLYEAHLAGSPLPPVTTRSDEARYARRLIDASRRRARARVTICEDGSFIEHPTRGCVEVRSGAARSMLAALVDAFERGPTPTLHRDALVRIGWPQRRRVDAASRNRLNVELSRLRKAGLHDQLERNGDAYRLTGPLLVVARAGPG